MTQLSMPVSSYDSPPASPTGNTTSPSSPLSRHGSLRRRLADDPRFFRDAHPLSEVDGQDEDDAASDISRPTLRRLTSETERQVAESSRSGGGRSSEASGSARGSFDLLRMSKSNEGSGEVEVLVHHVKPSESLAGIALLYGIDLPTLRKINKLWTSDSVHLRTHLYVPIEACRWNKASETFIRGPGPGQITLVPKTSSSRKGKTPIRSREASVSSPPRPTSYLSPEILETGLENLEMEDGWGDVSPVSPAQTFLNGTNESYDRGSLDSIRPTTIALEEAEDDTPEQRIVDVVRIPNSQLRFFPRPQRPPDGERKSLEQEIHQNSLQSQMRRSSSLIDNPGPRRPSGPSIQNDLSTLPLPLQSSAPKRQTSLNGNMVRIRPAGSTSPSLASVSSLVPNLSTSKLADKVTSFFTIPPPPDPTPRMPSNGRTTRIQTHRPKLNTSGWASDPDIPLQITKGPKGKVRVATNKKLD